MAEASAEEITQLLKAWSEGDRVAFDRLMPLVYQELHRLAHRYMKREHAGHTLQTSALVNEAYLKLINEREMHWQSRAHFFAVASQMMRQILVDYARSRCAAKRGDGKAPVALEDAIEVSEDRLEEFLSLDEALNNLAKFDSRKSRIAELRFFGGLSVEEAAHAIGVSEVTVMREWRLAKAWLHDQLNDSAVA
ncbi:MAG TPA: sigma-70 family RNA polymerase sigma factor [Blastocatellia bacterium]|nr:sigma-70 family RNA polymerase sigma factor [Blastocatellia bacterium]